MFRQTKHYFSHIRIKDFKILTKVQAQNIELLARNRDVYKTYEHQKYRFNRKTLLSMVATNTII